MASLIFDIGSHEGMDTAYYLRGGATVVALDADPRMTEMLATRFAPEVGSGSLKVVNRAVAERPDQRLTFYRAENSWWSSLDKAVADREHGNSEMITVEATTLSALIEEYGLPDYCKIDIEGLDATAIRTLGELTPRFISAETECSGEEAVKDPLATLGALADRGYTRFKLIEQRSLSELRPDEPFFHLHHRWSWRIRKRAHQRLGIGRLDPHYHSHRTKAQKYGYMFPSGATGPFGDQLTGDWLDLATAERTLQYHRAAYFRTPWATPWGFWCDWHATKPTPTHA